MSGTGDALSAASLVLAALALVYAAWSASIDAAINMPKGTTPAATERMKETVRAVRKGRAWPFAIACWLNLAVFFWRDMGIVTTAFQCIGRPECKYDDIAAVFFLTQVLVFGMAWHAGGQIKRLSAKL